LLPVVEKIQHLQLNIVWWSAFEPPPTGVFAGEEVTLMEHDHLIGQVQHRARLTSRGEAEVAVRATLQTLEERTSEGTYQNLIARLPQGIGDYQNGSEIDRRRPGERFGLDEFIERVARRESVRKQDAAFHARCVLEVVDEATTGRTMSHIKEELPQDFRPLFEAGSQGEMKTS
jgi:uncharacterized protein (DUF2267 family)